MENLKISPTLRINFPFFMSIKLLDIAKKGRPKL